MLPFSGLHVQHPDATVQNALIKLADALCAWERSTGRRSMLILKEDGGYATVFDSGKPIDFTGIVPNQLFEQIR